MTAILAAGMLALGVAVGAAIGPAPTASFAIDRLMPLLPSLLRAGERASTATVKPPASTPQATPEAGSALRKRRRRHKRARSAAAEASSAQETQATTETTPATTTPASTGKTKTLQLPPVRKVWLIELANSSFGEASADPAAAPYIDATAVPSGTLLSAWSGVQASAFAATATLEATGGAELIDTIVQPPCPSSISASSEMDDDSSPEGEGAVGGTAGAAGSTAGPAGGQCQADTPGALSAADEFLKATLPAITSTPGYRENGLVVVTFASVASATASGLPAGATTATLTSRPPAGALLISPFAKPGEKSSTALNPTSPKQSMEKLLRR
jgi:hypothetical protein